MEKVLLLDNYDSFTYNLAQLLYESKLCEYEIIKNDLVNINNINKFDKILISPGAGLPINAGKLNEIIEKYHKTKPILGICLGMQAIAEFFGAKLYNLEVVYHGVQTKTLIVDKEDVIFKNISKSFKTGLYHSWAVFKDFNNTDLNISAVSETGIIMGINHKTYNIKGIQFHPESYMTQFGKKIIENWLIS